jgi:CzcA family heavy metal efflux pump
MMRWIIGSSINFRYLVVAGAAALIAVGILQLRDSPVDVFPEFAPPRVEIQTITLGLSATETEALVTVPLEQALQGLPDLDTIRSKSVPGLSSITIYFEPRTDLLEARQLVAERVGSVTPSLPTWAAPPVMIQPLSATSRVMKIGMSSDTVSLIDMSMLAYWNIRARLLQVPGVANVPIWGERLHMFQVEVDPARMAVNRVSLDDVMESTANALDAGLLKFSAGSVIGTGGFVDTPNQRLTIQHVQPIVTPAELAKATVPNQDGEELPLSQVSDLVIDHQPLAGDAVVNDGLGLMLVVEKLPWANTLDVTRGVEEALDQLRPGLPGIDIDTTIFRPATFIQESIDNLEMALIIGSILVILVIGAFLFEWRAALISLAAIPLSVVAAGLVLYVRGETINVMVLAGIVIALGVIVDDAIIDVQNIVRRLRQYRLEGSQKSTASIVLEASLEMRGPIVYATLIVVLAIVPVFFLEGLTGSFFQPLAMSYALAVLVSLLVALTVTPALSLILLSKTKLERRESPISRWLERGYERLLERIVRRPLRAYIAVCVVVASGAAVVPFLGQSLLPDFKERDFLMHWLTQPSTSGPEETRVSIRACRELRTIPGVRNCGSHIGQALLSDEVVGIYFGENWISVDPSADYDATLARVQAVVAGYPGIYRDVQTYLKERIREVLTGSSEALVVRVSGDDLDVIRATAERVEEAIAGIDGIIDEHVDLQDKVPQVHVEVNLDAAQRYGLKPGDVRRASGVLIASEEVGDLFFGGRAYDVNVWSSPETRSSLTSIRELPIDTPRGDQVRLGEVADVRIEPTPNVVERWDVARTIDVGANVSGRDLGSVAADVEDALEDIEFPLGTSAEVLGEYKERQSAQKRLLSVGILAAIGIFLLLQASFKSWRLATLSFLTLPMALVGGALAAYIGDGIISLGSLVGFFTVLGIAARNGILMINHFQHLERLEGQAFGPALVLRGARERLSPILMTTLATGLALVPLVVAGNVPGHEIEHPLAVVVVGGLITSTLLNLLVLPALYLRVGEGRNARAPAAELGLGRPAH